MKYILFLLLSSLILYSCGENKVDTRKRQEVERLVGAKSDVDFEAAEIALDSIGVYELTDIYGKKYLFTDTIFRKYKPPVDTLPDENKPPIVNAGNDQAITLPTNTVTLSGFANDPEGDDITYKWVKLSGGSATITNSTSPVTTVTGLSAGSYQFRLGAIDEDGATGTDDVNVAVNTAPAPPTTFQGFGSQTPGGTGKPVFEVTTLSPTGTGSISAAWGSNRTIQLKVSGIIKGWRMPGSGVSFLTLDGTTSANGVTFEGSTTNKGTIFAFDGSGFNNIIIKNIRVRGGVGAQDNDGDGINCVNGANNIVFDHVSSSGNNDGNLDLTSGANNITVQNCILGGGVTSGQNTGWWSGTMLIAYEGTRNLSVHHNFFSPRTSGSGVGERSPYIHAGVDGDSRNTLMVHFANNVVYNWESYGSGMGYNSASIFDRNYYKSDQNSGRAIDPRADQSGGTGSKYIIRENFSANGASFPSSTSGNSFSIPTNVTTTDACTAAAYVKANAGCRPLDAVDQALLNAFTVTGCSPSEPTPCTGYTYSAWSTCVNGQQSRTVTGTTPGGCTGNPSNPPVLTQACTPNPGGGDYPGYTLVRSIPFDKASDINSNQLGRGGFSTFGGGSFRSEVRAGDEPISSGWRSEQQYGSNETPKEGIYEYEVYYENWGSFDGGGHSVQWHPYTSGASANISLQNYSNRWDVTRAIGNDVTHQQNPPSHQSNRWYKIRWEVRFSTGSDGYIRLFVDGVQTYSHTGRNDDESGQYFKLGQNRWPAGNGNSMQKTSVCYYKNLKIYRKN